MADVWLAEHAALDRQVALKFLKPEFAGDETYVRRFRVEAQAAARLVHSNIVQIYAVGQADGLHYIAQEYVSGQNLREFLVRHGPPEVGLAVSIIAQVAAALHKAAEHGIIHRDIKPENIMLARNGEVKVADFGLARVAGGQQLNLTQVGMTMGTPLYMSPEQVEGREVDSRTDIYSFGVTCYHMLSGNPPFRGETALSVAVQHLKTRPEPLETQRPDLPPALCRLVHKMLAKDPAQRFQSAREILQDLRALRASEGLGDLSTALEELETLQPIGLLNPATERLGNAMKTQAMLLPKRRRWRMAVAGSVVVALVLGLVLAMFSRERPLVDRLDPWRPAVAKEESVQQQYLRAMQLDNELGWRSVLEHWTASDPQQEYYRQRSRQQLAMLYLDRDDLSQAAELFQQFERSPEPLWHDFGVAGRAVILHRRGRTDEARVLVQQELPGQSDSRNMDPATLQLLGEIGSNTPDDRRTLLPRLSGQFPARES
jgi:serine/threonine-protein kinase